jgi:hypothetical protein
MVIDTLHNNTNMTFQTSSTDNFNIFVFTTLTWLNNGKDMIVTGKVLFWN